MKKGYLLGLLFGVFLSTISSAKVLHQLEDPVTGTMYIIESVESADAASKYKRKQYAVHIGKDRQSLIPHQAEGSSVLSDGDVGSYSLEDGREIWIRQKMWRNEGAFVVDGATKTELARYKDPEDDYAYSMASNVNIAEKLDTVKGADSSQPLLQTKSLNIKPFGVSKVYTTEDKLSSLVIDKTGDHFWVTDNKAIYIGDSSDGSFFDPTGLQVKFRVLGRTAILESNQTSEFLIMKQNTDKSFIDSLKKNPPQMASYEELVIFDGHYNGSSGSPLTLGRSYTNVSPGHWQFKIRVIFNDNVYEMDRAAKSQSIYLGKEKEIRLRSDIHSSIYLKNDFSVEPNSEILIAKQVRSKNFPDLVGILSEPFKLIEKVGFVDLPPPQGATSPGTELIKLHQECKDILVAKKDPKN